MGTTAATLEAYLHEVIPVSKLLGIQVETCGPGSIVLTAPLDINHNHLGTAFGGSLAVVATLAGYCALWSAVEDHKLHIVVRRSSIDYRRPVTGFIRATCQLPPDAIGDNFMKHLAKTGKARLTLEATISENEEECVRLTGDFVVLK